MTQGEGNQAVVIGSGFGGLAAAFQALAKGYEVTLLEAGDQPGGRARHFENKGYHFDAGPTVITAPQLFDELFGLIGEKPSDYFELKAIDPFYRVIFPDNSHFDYVGDDEQLVENIRKISPGDVDGFHKLSKHSQEIFEVGYTRLADKPFDSITSMMRVVPDMIRLENYRSVYALVARYIKDDRLRQAFSFEPLLVGGNPFRITSIYLLIHWLERKWGVHFAMGGTTSIVKGMCTALARKGVQFHYNASVNRIEVENGRVTGVGTTDGDHYPCNVLISNADPVKLYRDWVDRKKVSRTLPLRLKRRKFSMGLFVTYLGVRKKYPNLTHHSILLGPRYKGLLNDIFSRKVLADDFSLYLHAPTVTDPSLAPEGCESMYVLSPVPNNESGINWEKEETAYREKILAYLEKKLLPGLRDHLEVSFSVTPDYFEKELQSSAGSAFGIEPSFQQSAYFRFHNRSQEIKGLYHVGSNTHPGAGVPGVINSAKVLQEVLPKVEQGALV